MAFNTNWTSLPFDNVPRSTASALFPPLVQFPGTNTRPSHPITPPAITQPDNTHPPTHLPPPGPRIALEAGRRSLHSQGRPLRNLQSILCNVWLVFTGSRGPWKQSCKRASHPSSAIIYSNPKKSQQLIGQVFPAPFTQRGQTHGRSNSHNIILSSVAHGDPVLLNRSIS